jgi:hypothetical protein
MSLQKSQSRSRLWSILVAPIAVAVWIGRHVKRVFVSPPTVREARALEKERQRDIRRKLRGLPKAA